MGILPNNIRAIRQQRGLTLEQLAALTPHATKPGEDTDLSTIHKLEGGKRKLTAEWKASIAQALGVEPEDLTGSYIAAKPVKRAMKLGRIPAGNFREAIESATEWVLTTKGGPNTFALEVEGDSMDRLVKSGVTIFVDPDQIELVDEGYYAMVTPDGQATFKQFRTGPMRLEPLSKNPTHKTLLVGEEGLITVGRVLGAELDFERQG